MMNFINYSNIGKKIKERRLYFGLTQEQLAEECGISASFMAHIENGSRRLSLDTIVAISNILDIKLDYLLLDELSSNTSKIEGLEAQLSRCNPKQVEKFIKISKILISNIDEI